MERMVPVQFNDVSFSPLEQMSNVPNVGHTKVRVFSKYRNRNGSYITDEVAEALIKSAVEAHVPVVGFYDKETEDFTSHVREDLACAYGFCDDFLGWEKHEDEDGVEREYAVFSVFLHTEYFAAAGKIVGNPQSMELDIDSISGDWVTLNDGAEVYVYETARMKGLAVLGKSVEPCFQGAAFFSMQDKFEMLVNELVERVHSVATEDEEEKEDMIFKVRGVESEDYQSLFEKLNPNYDEEHQFEVGEVIFQMEDGSAKSYSCEDGKEKTYAFSKDEEGNLQFELVSERSCDGFEADCAHFAEMAEQAGARVEELVAELDEAKAKIAEYEAQFKAIEDGKKAKLVESYENSLSDEEIAPIREQIDTFNYDELEAKLAVCFARKSVGKEEARKIPVPEDDERVALAKLMEKYRK